MTMAMTMTMTTIMIMKYSPEARLELTRQVQDGAGRRSQKIVQPLLERSGFIMMTIVMMIMTLMVILNTKTARLMMMTVEMKVLPALADCPAVSLDLCIYTTNKYPNVKHLS